MPRLFIAIDPPEPLREALSELRSDLRGARWVPRAQLHLTLRFLGQQPDEDVPAILRALTRVRAPSFSLTLVGLGVFPRRPTHRNPARILWAGVAPELPVLTLKQAIDAALDTTLGPDPEQSARGFSPHLTLARFKDDPGAALDRLLAHAPAPTALAWPVRTFHLYESQTLPAGAQHALLETFPFTEP